MDLRLAKKSLGSFRDAEILVSAVLYRFSFSWSLKDINLLFISILCLLYKCGSKNTCNWPNYQ